MGLYIGRRPTTFQPQSAFDIEEPFASGIGAVYDYTKYTNPFNTIDRVADRNLLDYVPESLEGFQDLQFKSQYDAGGPITIDQYATRRETLGRPQVEQMARDRGIDPARLPKGDHSREWWDHLFGTLEVKQAYETRMERTKGGVGYGAAALGVGVLAFAQDPLNVATFFMPGVGLSARAAQFTANAANVFSRSAIRAGIGLGEGLAAGAIVEPLYYATTRQEDLDYDMGTALTNIAIGGAFGAAINPFVSPRIEKMMMQKEVEKVLAGVEQTVLDSQTRASQRLLNGEEAPAIPYDIAPQPTLKSAVAESIKRANRQTVEVVMRAAINQLMNGQPINVMGILNGDVSVQAFSQSLRNADTWGVMRELITDEFDNWLTQADMSKSLPAAQRKKVVAQLEKVKKAVDDLTKLRETANRRALRGDLATQMQAVRKDKAYVEQLQELEAQMKELKNTLAQSRASKDTKAAMNDLFDRISSGEFTEQAITRSGEMMDMLRQIQGADRSTFVPRITPGETRAGTDKVASTIGKLDADRAAEATDEAKALDIYNEELEMEVLADIDEAAVGEMNKIIAKQEQSAKDAESILRDFQACKAAG